jgi:hypothetical protein
LEVSGQLHAPASLPPVLIGEEVGWALQPVWTTWRGEKSCPSNSNPSAMQPVASGYTNCTILPLLTGCGDILQNIYIIEISNKCYRYPYKSLTYQYMLNGALSKVLLKLMQFPDL